MTRANLQSTRSHPQSKQRRNAFCSAEYVAFHGGDYRPMGSQSLTIDSIAEAKNNQCMTAVWLREER